jgi:hypothetical protein
VKYTGHHRYVCSLLAKKDIGKVPTHKTSATKAHDWKQVVFVDTEWDTLEKIEKLNKQDADFNNVALEKILEMIK